MDVDFLETFVLGLGNFLFVDAAHEIWILVWGLFFCFHNQIAIYFCYYVSLFYFNVGFVVKPLNVHSAWYHVPVVSWLGCWIAGVLLQWFGATCIFSQGVRSLRSLSPLSQSLTVWWHGVCFLHLLHKSIFFCLFFFTRFEFYNESLRYRFLSDHLSFVNES